MSDITVVHAKKILSMDDNTPKNATCVAVQGPKIVAVGTQEQVLKTVGDKVQHDNSFKDNVILPGFIDQHLHPVLGAVTLADGVIAPESWDLPTGTTKAATTPEEYHRALTELAASTTSDYVLTWGYHPLWHGEIDKAYLDKITTKPMVVWHRSAHEFYFNSASLANTGITLDTIRGKGVASEQVNLEKGHFWESGTNFVAEQMLAIFAAPPRMIKGLKLLVKYLHMNGVTAINEPGVLLTPDIWKLYQALLENPTVPFYSTFFPDGRTLGDKFGVDKMLEKVEEQIKMAPEQMPGKHLNMFDKTVKLFCDGAIISQAMQMKDGYLDGHNGEWMIPPEDLKKRWKILWDAGYQIHCHVNGDLGLETVLDIVEYCQKENSRSDHRTVIVHFANSTEEQVVRIKKLGCIVSANPYYPVGFGEMFSEIGLGPDRAQVMVRAKSALNQNLPLSFHSDCPMGPAAPLKLASFAVNRTNASGKVIGASQCIDVMDALKGITINSAYSWRKEHLIGSVTPGKIANLTILKDDPLSVEKNKLHEIPILATVFEGKVFPVEGMEVHMELSGEAPKVELGGCCSGSLNRPKRT